MKMLFKPTNKLYSKPLKGVLSAFVGVFNGKHGSAASGVWTGAEAPSGTAQACGVVLLQPTFPRLCLRAGLLRCFNTLETWSPVVSSREMCLFLVIMTVFL